MIDSDTGVALSIEMVLRGPSSFVVRLCSVTYGNRKEPYTLRDNWLYFSVRQSIDKETSGERCTDTTCLLEYLGIISMYWSKYVF